ncbi:hypothetical protein [Massilia aquatica]|uniref:DUF3300 domain-containing protein n=1 Tax=Massilia aquatica TaxID=2609000 RepID=A0ABX0LY51_9BURK|nr:hypothetical protein [Massilia aquatica]NHZ39477.1 hypothetical protein [Massilia aquatica]
MKNLLIAAVLLGASLSGQAQVNVRIDIGQPGFYGRIDPADFGRPPVVYTQPIVVERHARGAPEPVYLRVPPGHMKKWSKHCARYDACGRQVYFVRDEWYTNTYAPRYREMRGGGGRERDHGRDRGYDRHDRHDRDGRGHGNGNGRGNGNGHGNGHDRDTNGFR